MGEGGPVKFSNFFEGKRSCETQMTGSKKSAITGRRAHDWSVTVFFVTLINVPAKTTNSLAIISCSAIFEILDVRGRDPRPATDVFRESPCQRVGEYWSRGPTMKLVIPEISWHNRDPVLSAHFRPIVDDDDDDKGRYRLATGGSDSHVFVSAPLSATIRRPVGRRLGTVGGFTL